ncbi:MAG: hypothetical protein KGJ13_11525 [Patescibacteria group bacterium]|nr:hypothetical protein [Patescibacteria group bacterium]
MAAQFDSTTRNTWATDLNTALGTSALLKIFTGAPPANCGTADSGTLLATLTCAAAGFGSASSGVLTANAIASVTAGAAGTAGYFRLYNSSVVCKAQGTVATSGADLNFNNVGWASGDTITISSFVLTMPGA